MNVSQLSEKKSNFKSCLLKGNHVACFSLLRRYQGMVNNIPILNAVREALLKVAVHSGFAACYQAHFKEQCIEQESNLNHFIYNLCLFMVEKDNESIFVPQYADCYVCLVRPINFLFSDNMLFCNNEIMKSRLFALFTPAQHPANNYPLKLALCIVECLFSELIGKKQLQALFRFGTYCMLFLLHYKVQMLWEVFGIFLNHHEHFKRQKTLMEWFSYMAKIACQQKQKAFSSIHRSLVMNVGYAILFGPIIPQRTWHEINTSAGLENTMMTTTDYMSMIPTNAANTSSVESLHFKMLDRFKRKFPSRNVYFNEPFNEDPDAVAPNVDQSDRLRSYFDLLKYYYLAYHENIKNFSIRGFLTEKAAADFPITEQGQLSSEKEQALQSFEIYVISPFLTVGFPNAPWGTSLTLLTDDALFVPWLYHSDITHLLYAGVFVPQEVRRLNALKHFWMITKDFMRNFFVDDDESTAFLSFEIKDDAPFSMFYTEHAVELQAPYEVFLKESNNGSDMEQGEKCILIYYFVSCYVAGFHSTFMEQDIIVDVNNNIFFAGFFRKDVLLDYALCRKEVLHRLASYNFPPALILGLLSDLKTEMNNSKYKRIVENRELNNLFSIASWPALLDEISQAMVRPQQ